MVAREQRRNDTSLMNLDGVIMYVSASADQGVVGSDTRLPLEHTRR